MATPEATPGVTPRLITEVSSVLLKPLVTVVATLGNLGATAHDTPLDVPERRLRVGLVALAMEVRRAMGDCHHDVTWLRQALAAAMGTTPGSPGAATKGGWDNVAAEVSEWQVQVTSLEGAWTRVAGATETLRGACETKATAAATTTVDLGHLQKKVAQSRSALQELVVATQSLPVASEPDKVTSALEEHQARVAKATQGFLEATEATEEAVKACVASMDAKGWGQQAEVAVTFLGCLVAACHGVVGFYRHLRCHLKAIEDMVATMAGGGPGVPEELVAAVGVAEQLWDASTHLINRHLLGTLQFAQNLLLEAVPDVTKVKEVTQQREDATATLLELLQPPQGQQ